MKLRNQWLVGNQRQSKGPEPGWLTPSHSSLYNARCHLLHRAGLGSGFLLSVAPGSWSPPPLWLLTAGSLVCFLTLNRLDTLVSDLRGFRKERQCFVNSKHQSRSSKKQAPAVSPCPVRTREDSKGLGCICRIRLVQCLACPESDRKPDWGREV